MITSTTASPEGAVARSRNVSFPVPTPEPVFLEEEAAIWAATQNTRVSDRGTEV